jgi:hypothetical protein
MLKLSNSLLEPFKCAHCNIDVIIDCLVIPHGDVPKEKESIGLGFLSETLILK